MKSNLPWLPTLMCPDGHFKGLSREKSKQAAKEASQTPVASGKSERERREGKIERKTDCEGDEEHQLRSISWDGQEYFPCAVCLRG